MGKNRRVIYPRWEKHGAKSQRKSDTCERWREAPVTALFPAEPGFLSHTRVQGKRPRPPPKQKGEGI